MENNKDYEKRLGRRLREAYLKEYKGPAMSREDFHRLIEAAEKKKNHKKAMIGLAAACVAICLVCGGFVAGISMRESASAGKDGETKTVQQGGSVVIGSGVSENDQNVGVSTKTYTDIGDIPEDLREQIHFLDSDEFELEKVKISFRNETTIFFTRYKMGGEYVEITEQKFSKDESVLVLNGNEKKWDYKKVKIYERNDEGSKWFYFEHNKTEFSVLCGDAGYKKIKAIIDDLIF